MKNNSNIYDIDGNIIRKAGDTHKFTIEEVEKMLDDMTEKVKNNPDNNTYKVYLNNLHRYLAEMYKNMSEDELTKKILSIKDSLKTAHEEAVEVEEEGLNSINEELDDLKGQYVEFEEVNEADKEDLRALHSGSTELDGRTDKEILENAQ